MHIIDFYHRWWIDWEMAEALWIRNRYTATVVSGSNSCTILTMSNVRRRIMESLTHVWARCSWMQEWLWGRPHSDSQSWREGSLWSWELAAPAWGVLSVRGRGSRLHESPAFVLALLHRPGGMFWRGDAPRPARTSCQRPTPTVESLPKCLGSVKRWRLRMSGRN